MGLHAQMIIAGFLGAFIHLLVKVGQINKRLCTTDYKTVFKEYWRTDWVWVLLAFVGITTAVFISNEWLNAPEDSSQAPTTFSAILQLKLIQFVKTAFVVVGYCIDSAIAAGLSGTEQKLIKKAKDAGVSMEDIISVKADKIDPNQDVKKP